MNLALAPLGISQGVAASALAGPEELARRAGLPELLRLGSNESPFGPSPRASAAYVAQAGLLHRYGDPSVAELRSAIARKHGIDEANVAVGAGIDDLLGWTVRAYLASGATAIAADGAFPTFEMHVNGFGGTLERVPYRADGHVDLEGFLHAAQRLDGGLIFLPNPDNPSGTAYEWNDVVAFLDALPDGALVVHDEAYANFLEPNRRFPKDAVDARMLRMRTFSKEYGLAGARVGYAIGARESIAALDAVRLLYGVSRPAQAAAIAALADDEWMEDVVARIAEGRAGYYALGARLGIPARPSTTNFVLFDFGDPGRATGAVQRLLEHGIHVRKPQAPPLDGCIRVSVGTRREREHFGEVLAALRI